MQLHSVLGAVDDATAGPAVEDAVATADFGAGAGQPSDQHAIRSPRVPVGTLGGHYLVHCLAICSNIRAIVSA